MKTTGHARTAFELGNGLRALLRGPLFGKGSGASLPLLLLPVVVLAVLAFSTAPVLAAAPEAPTLELTGRKATEASLRGVLNPNVEGEEGTYEVLYKQSKTECQGGQKSTQGLALGVQGQEIDETLGGLEEGKEYTACLLAENAAHQQSLSTPLKFTTTITPETPADEEAVEVTPQTATLEGVLNPSKQGEPGLYYFRYAESSTECGGATERDTEGVSAIGHSPEPVEAKLTNLLAGTTYTFCLVVQTEAGEFAVGAPVTFTAPLGPPAVGDEATASVGSASATVRADINPSGLSTSYRVEYATEAELQAYGWGAAMRVPASGAELPATSEPVPVSEQLLGLQPETTYAFRYAAVNSRGTIFGAEAQFATALSVSSSLALPDGRVYELVSTSGNFGEPYRPTSPSYGPKGNKSEHPVQAADNGETVAYIGELAASGGDGNQGDGEGDNWLARRTPQGWETEVITPRGNRVGADISPVFQAFSADLSTGIVETQAQPPLVSGVPSECKILYSRAASTGAYTALLTSTQTPGKCGSPTFAGDTESESQTIFQSEAALTASAEEATEVPAGHANSHSGGYGAESGEPCMYGCNLYDSVGGELRLVNVLPGAEAKTVPNATFGGYAGPDRKTNFSNAISADGLRIFWTDTQEIENGKPNPDFEHVFVLENGAATVQVSGGGQAEYWTATRDGRYAYYTETGRLWRFDTDSNTSEALTAVGSELQGVIGVNETGPEGSYVYFVADGALAPGATSKTCLPIGPRISQVFKEFTEGEISREQYEAIDNPLKQEEAEEKAGSAPPHTGCNLYLLHEGATKLVATLAPEDNDIEAAQQAPEHQGDWMANLGHRTAAVASNGERLVFESSRRLTGYDNSNQEPGGNLQEVFDYDAAEAQLACASCNPGGARSDGYQRPNQSLLPASRESNTYIRRWMADDGKRIFFESPQKLTGQYTTGEGSNVYEWESEGEGTCSVQASPRLNRGCVSLLARGYFVDADASGNNVFVEHEGQLGQAEVPVSQNELYDVRVDGGFFNSSFACNGSGCQGVPPAPPIFATPATVTFSGVGNFSTSNPGKVVVKSLTRAKKLARALKVCRRDKQKRKRVRCERVAKKNYGAKAKKTTRKAGNKRGAKS